MGEGVLEALLGHGATTADPSGLQEAGALGREEAFGAGAVAGGLLLPRRPAEQLAELGQRLGRQHQGLDEATVEILDLQCVGYGHCRLLRPKPWLGVGTETPTNEAAKPQSPIKAAQDCFSAERARSARLCTKDELEEFEMPRAWSAKRERQYEHIRDGLEERGREPDLAEEIAARTVNKERARSGEARQASRSSTKGISSGRRGGLRSHSGPGGRTKQQLYNEARQRNISGRSKMTKSELEHVLGGR